MQVKPIVHRVKGFYRLADYALRWGMIAPDAQRRLEILGFWRRHGLAATCEAFKLSRRTLYLWRAKLKAEGGNVAALVPGSTAPKRRRQRQWPAALVAELRRLRTEHPNLGKEKLHLLVAPFAAAAPAALPQCPHHRTPDRRRAGQDALAAAGVRAPPASRSRCASRACANPSTSGPSGPAIAWPWTASNCGPRASAAT